MPLKTMLDSGAYTAFRQNRTIDIDEYAEFVKMYGHEFTSCITLDVINDAKNTYRNWLYLRKQGIDVLPVFHLGTDEKWLKKYLKLTDHICLGAIANLSTKQRLLGLTDVFKRYFVDTNLTPKVKVHGLGLTAVPIMLQFPWHSVDSMTPLISAVFGRIFLPSLKEVNDWEGDYYKGTFVAVSDQSKRKKVSTDFAGIPPMLQERYEQMFIDNGFELGELYYVKKNLTRNDKIRLKKEKEEEERTGIMTAKQRDLEIKLRDPVISGNETLANSWWRRLDWNIKIWTQLIDRTPPYPRKLYTPTEVSHLKQVNDPEVEKSIMYFGVSTTTHLQRMTLAERRPDMLASFAFMSEGFLQAIINHKDESYEPPEFIRPVESK